MVELTPHHRVDVYLPNDSEGFCLLAAELLGALPSDDAEQWQDCVRDGLVLPVALDVAEGLVVGVRLGPADPTEEAEAIGELRSWLQLPSGHLALTPGSLYWEWTGLEEPCLLRLPPGDYSVRLLRFATGINGRRWHDALRRSGERPLELHRRTRPNAQPADWLKLLDALHIEVDGSESWDLDEASYTALEESVLDKSYLDFLIQLEPLVARPSFPGLQGPWLREPSPRVPEVCPAGLPSGELLELEGEDDLLREMFEEVSTMVGEALSQLPEPALLLAGQTGHFSAWDSVSWATARFRGSELLRGNGFESLGTLGCEARPGMLFKVLRRGPVYAVLQRGADGQESLAYLSSYPDGSVFASRGPEEGTSEAAPPADFSCELLLSRHETELTRRVATLGEPRTAGPDLADAARCLDALWAVELAPRLTGNSADLDC